MSSTNFPTNPQGYSLLSQFHESWTFSSVGFALLAILLSYGAFLILKPDPLAHIPALGGSDLLSAYLTGKKFKDHSRDLLNEGYIKYQKAAFRIPDDVGRWHVMVSRQDQIEDLQKAPYDVMSFKKYTNEMMFFDYLVANPTNHYHVDILYSHLTRNLALLFNDIREEIRDAFDENIPLTEDWTSVNVYSKMVQIIARASNRIFVGLPLCRDPEFLKINIELTMHVGKSRKKLMLLPSFMRHWAARYITTSREAIAKAAEFLDPFIQERRKKLEEYGHWDYPDKPTDLLQWLMEEAPGPDDLSVINLTTRIVLFNFAAIHTSSMSFTHALYRLAAEPHYIQPLREEIEAVMAEDGWTKVAMTRMHKLDSFFKETQRYDGNGFTSLGRLALKDFTFSDGTFIPKGTLVTAAASAIHWDNEKYPESNKFDGFRFAEIRSHEGLITTNQYVNTSPDYIPFGHGKHACPGRFFIANELKAMMAHILLNYDVKMENEGVRPPSISLGFAHIPDRTAEVMFRRRRM